MRECVLTPSDLHSQSFPTYRETPVKALIVQEWVPVSQLPKTHDLKALLLAPATIGIGCFTYEQYVAHPRRRHLCAAVAMSVERALNVERMVRVQRKTWEQRKAECKVAPYLLSRIDEKYVSLSTSLVTSHRMGVIRSPADARFNAWIKPSMNGYDTPRFVCVPVKPKRSHCLLLQTDTVAYMTFLYYHASVT